MTIGYVTGTRNDRLDEVTAAMDAGASGANLRIYSGSRPATGGATTTLLAELTFSTTSAPAASGGVLTANAITPDSSANATGTATWFRAVDSDNNTVLDGSVGSTGSGEDLELNSTSIATGQEVRVSSFVITEGNP